MTVSLSIREPGVANELLAMLRQVGGPAPLDDRSELERIADRLVAIVKRPDVDGTPLARRLVAVHDELASHLLAALDFELAGLPAERTRHLLQRARNHMADGLADALATLAS